MKSTLGIRLASKRRLKLISLSFVMMISAACHARLTSDTKLKKTVLEARTVTVPMGTQIQLTLSGYNYTNRYIDQFDVDGQGGGNLFVSEGLSGGGKSVCCISYRSGANAPKVRIRWQSGACIFTSYIDDGGDKHEGTHNYFREVDVQVDSSIPNLPRYFEVHFYPDGHIDASITEHESTARLIMNARREDNSKYPRCPNDAEPKN